MKSDFIDYSGDIGEEEDVRLFILGSYYIAYVGFIAGETAFNGNIYPFGIELRYLSSSCKNSNDENYVCVSGSEIEYQTVKDIEEFLDDMDMNILDVIPKFKLNYGVYEAILRATDETDYKDIKYNINKKIDCEITKKVAKQIQKEYEQFIKDNQQDIHMFDCVKEKYESGNFPDISKMIKPEQKQEMKTELRI